MASRRSAYRQFIPAIMDHDPESQGSPQIQLQALKTLLAIREARSAKAAADSLNRTVSAVTRQIQELETRLGGVRLFDRHSRGMRLTPAGEKYAEEASRALGILDRAQEEITLSISERTRRKRVKVHISEVLVDGYLLPVLNDFAAKHPQISVDVSIGSAEDACKAVETETAAFAMMYGVDELSGLEKYREIDFVDRVDYPLMAVVHREHVLATYGSMTLKDLLQSGWPLALPPERYATRQHFEALLRRVEPTVNLSDYVEAEINSYANLKRYAMLRRAIIILPALAASAEMRKGTLVSIPIEGIESERTSFSLFRHSKSKFDPATASVFGVFENMFKRLKSDRELLTKPGTDVRKPPLYDEETP